MRTTSGRLTITALLAIGLLVSSCSSSGSTGSAAPGSTAAPTTTSPNSPSPVSGTFVVGRTDITLVDTGRPTAADTKNGVAAKDSRTLPVMILYPTATESDDGKPNGHPVAAGRFPLFLFSHGVTASGPIYAGFLIAIVQAGYVVAAPTFPLTSGGHGWDNLSRYVDQPKDVSFVLTELLAQSKSATGLLSGHLAPDAIAAGGHSLGAMTTIGFFNSADRDDRIDALVEISGIEAPFGKGSFDNPPATPLLLIHGQKDGTVPYEGSKKLFEKLTRSPRALLSYPDGSHVGVVFEGTFKADSQAAIIAFLNLELRHDDAAWRGLAKKLSADELGSIEVAGGLPSPS